MTMGRTAEQVGASWKPADKYKGYTIAEAQLRTNVGVLYAELKK